MGSMIRWIAASASILALMAAARMPASASTPAQNGEGGAETPAFVLEEASFSQFYYRRGDEVVLQLVVNAKRASVSADFSAVDSGFRASAAQVKMDGDGRWVVRYRLSRGNTRQAGTFPVPISVRVPGRDPVTVPLTLDYLPLGPGVLSLPEGHFHSTPLPRREFSRALSVVADVQQDDRTPRQRGVDPASPILLTLRVSSDRRLPANALKLELAEARADGHWQVPVPLANEQCTGARCEYQARVLVRVDPEGPGRGHLAGMGRLVTPAGHAAPFPLPPFGKTARPSEDTHRISGSISFSFRNRFPDPTFSPLSPMYPWKAPRVDIIQQKPVRHAFVRLQDECGHDIEGTTSAFGNFVFDWTPVNCGTGTITVSSVSASQKAGVARWLNGTITNMGDLTGQSEDYQAYSWSFPFDTNDAAKATGGLDEGNRHMSSNAEEARAFYILDNVMIARAYYDTLPGVSMLYEAPTIGVVYSPGLKPDDVTCDEWDPSGYLTTAFYSSSKHPGFIYIPAEDGCDYGWEAHAHVHETSHLFQHIFLREADPAYGRFGEGMANVQGAVIRRTKWITGGAAQFEDLDVNSRMACWLDGQWDHDLDLRVDHPVAKDACIAAGGVAGFPVAAVWDPSTADAGWFQRVVWDLVDGGELDGEPLLSFVPEGMSPDECGPGGPCAVEQFDLVGGQGGDGIALAGTAPLNDVLIFYLGGVKAMGTNPNYVDRGQEGLDLVDVLDGMVCRGHMTVTEAQVLYGAMGFAYDGLGPATCPHPFD